MSLSHRFYLDGFFSPNFSVWIGIRSDSERCNPFSVDSSYYLTLVAPKKKQPKNVYIALVFFKYTSKPLVLLATFWCLSTFLNSTQLDSLSLSVALSLFLSHSSSVAVAFLFNFYFLDSISFFYDINSSVSYRKLHCHRQYHSCLLCDSYTFFHLNSIHSIFFSFYYVDKFRISSIATERNDGKSIDKWANKVFIEKRKKKKKTNCESKKIK